MKAIKIKRNIKIAQYTKIQRNTLCFNVVSWDLRKNVSNKL